MQARGVEVDHSSLNRWVLKYTPDLDKAFRQRKRSVGTSWRMGEKCIRIKGQWKYLLGNKPDGQGTNHCLISSSDSITLLF